MGMGNSFDTCEMGLTWVVSHFFLFLLLYMEVNYHERC